MNPLLINKQMKELEKQKWGRYGKASPARQPKVKRFELAATVQMPSTAAKIR